MSDYYSIRGWDKFQHYKDRNPPWIKLHTNLLDNRDFHLLSDTAKSQLVLLWALAARSDNEIDDDEQWIKESIHVRGKLRLGELEAAKFIEHSARKPLAPSDSTPLASRLSQSESDQESETQGHSDQGDLQNMIENQAGHEAWKLFVAVAGNAMTARRFVKYAQAGASDADFADARQGVASTTPKKPAAYACTIIENRLKEIA